MEEVNNIFETKIMSRLNDPKAGTVAVIAHRLHERDLSGYLERDSDWRFVTLECIAEGERSYPTKTGAFVRRKGDLLRPDYIPKKRIRQLRERPSVPEFRLLYQQGRGPRTAFSLRRKDLPLFDAVDIPSLPVVISIDPGQNGPDDQVDALTQFLDFVATKPELKQIVPKDKGISAVAHYSNPISRAPYVRGSVLVTGSSVFGPPVRPPPHHRVWGNLSDYYKD